MLRGHWIEVGNLNVAMPTCWFQSQYSNFLLWLLETCQTPAWSFVEVGSQMLVTTLGRPYRSLTVNTGPWMSFLILGLLHETCLCIPWRHCLPLPGWILWISDLKVSSRGIILTMFSIQPHDTYTEFSKGMIHEGSGATKLPIQQELSSHHFSSLVPRNMFFPVSRSSVAATMTLDYLSPYVFLYKVSVSEIIVLRF